MRVLVDARMMGAGRSRGIGRFIEETLRSVLEVDATIELTLIVRDAASSPFCDHPRVTHLVADIPWYSWQEQLRMPWIYAKTPADMVYVPHWNVPLCMPRRYICTIHDPLLLRMPWSSKQSTKHPLVAWIKHKAFSLNIIMCAWRARLVTVPTEFVKREMQELLRISDKKLRVIGEGVRLFTGKPDDTLTPNGAYLLVVGSAYPHKRLDMIVEAWAELSREYPELSLVFAGEMDVFMQRIRSQVQNNGLERVVFAGAVTDAQLAGLYDHAQALVFASEYEGFGLPPLEAFARGIPVVARDLPVLHEHLPSDAIVWFRESSVRGIIDGVREVLLNQERYRHRIAASQAEVMTTWSWNHVGQRLSELFRTFA